MAAFFKSFAVSIRLVGPLPPSHDPEEPPSYDMSSIPSLPGSPLPPPPPHPSRPRRFPWKRVAPIAISLAISGLLLAALVLLLLRYDGEAAPQWDAAITLNSAMAWLGTLSKMALLVPVAEAIGQMKWVLFGNGRRKLSDLDLVDGVSRDPLGALGWMVRFRGGFLVHVGAAFMVLSLAFDPAVQQLVEYRLQPAVDAGLAASVAANTLYSPVRGFNKGLIFATPRSLLWGATSSVLGAPLPADSACPSGDCTFPDTVSVGVCQTCTEITDTLDRNCTALSADEQHCVGGTCYTSGQLCTYAHNATAVGGGKTFLNLLADPGESVTTGGTVAISSTRIKLTALYIQPDPALQDSQSLPLAPGYVAPGAAHAARGYSCAISYCEQVLRARTVAGVFAAETVSEDQVDAYVLPVPALEEITDALMNAPVEVAASGKTRVSTAALYALSNGFPLSLTGKAETVSGLPGPGEVSEFHRGLYENLLETDFGSVMAAMAGSMSAAIRNDGEAVQGEVWVKRVFVAVKWEWMVVPVGLWVWGALLVCGVVARARKGARGPVGWLGGSQVAGVFLGLEEGVRRDVDTRGVAWTGDAGEVRAFAEKLRVRIGAVAVRGEGTPMRFTKAHGF